MKRTLIHLHRSLWMALIVILVLTALVLSAARIFSPYLSTQKPVIEHWASVLLDEPVEIGSVSMKWEGFTPVVKCSQVLVFDSQKTRPLLQVDELDLGVNVVASLLNSQFKISHLNIIGATITLRQNPDGHISFYGLGRALKAKSASDDGTGFDHFIQWILTAPGFSLQNITLNWYSKDGSLLPIKDLNFTIRNSAKYHQIWGSVSVDKPEISLLQYVVQIRGSWQQKANLNVKFYLKGDNVNLKQWLDGMSLQNYALQQGITNFQLWGTWDKEQLQEIQTLIVAQKLVINKLADHSQFHIPYLDTHAYWQNLSNQDWRLNADLRNVAFVPYNDIPGFTHLSGFLHAHPQTGYLYLNTNNTQLDFGGLFRQPLNLTMLGGLTSWEHSGNGWNITAKDIHIATVDSDLVTSMTLGIPSDQSSPLLNLQGKFHLGSARNIKNYLPLKILSPGLISWLDRSITKLDGIDATVIITGHLKDFPFDKNTGKFLVDSQIYGLNLKYLPAWPEITGLGGHLVFAGRSMTLDETAGKTMGILLNQVHATIPVMAKAVPAILQVNAKFADDIAKGMVFLQQSPLRDGMMGLAEKIQAKGPMKLQLGLTIPFQHDLPSKVTGQLVTNNAQVTIPAWNIQLSKLNGQFNFTQDQVTANNLSTVLWNKPLAISLSSANQQQQVHLRYQDMKIDAQSNKGGWLVSLNSPEALGQITVPTSSQAIQANFKRIYLSSDIMKGNTTQMSPTKIPAVNLTCADFRYGAKQFGQVKIQLQPIKNGVQIVSLTGTSPLYSLNAKGYWIAQMGKQSTSINGNLTSSNISGLLTSWDFPSAVSSKGTIVNFNLSWPGAAYNPGIAIMNGNVALAVQQGQLLQIGTSQVKMDIGRLLSLLSWQSLERRLKLDFSDLTTKGFSFNSISATLKLSNGNAYTQNAKMAGPVATVTLAGRIGLAAQDYDLQLTVTPHITSALPLIVGLATGPIGPIAAAATWAASKLVGFAVDKIAMDSYRVTGSWSKPSVVQVGGFLSPTLKDSVRKAVI